MGLVWGDAGLRRGRGEGMGARVSEFFSENPNL